MKYVKACLSGSMVHFEENYKAPGIGKLTLM